MQLMQELLMVESFTAFGRETKPQEWSNAEKPSAGPILCAYYKGDKNGEVALMLGVDPDDEEKRIRVAIDTASHGSKFVKYFPDDKDGYKEAAKYAHSLRTKKVNLS